MSPVSDAWERANQADQVGALCTVVAQVRALHALVHLLAPRAVARVARRAAALERPGKVGALIRKKAVVRAVRTFVNLGARGRRRQVSGQARAHTILVVRQVGGAGGAVVRRWAVAPEKTRAEVAVMRRRHGHRRRVRSRHGRGRHGC